MKVFGIDTTRKKARVFLVDSASEEIASLALNDSVKHSEGLFLYIEKFLMDKGIVLNDIDCFACVTGPGSFTGIRVGMATIMGLNKALKKSVIAMNMFEILSLATKKGFIVLNCTNSSCYYAKVNKGIIEDCGVVQKDEIHNLVKDEQLISLGEEQDIIGVAYDNCKTIDSLDDLYMGVVLDRLNAGNYGDFQPYYLQLSQAERTMTDDKK